MGEGWDEAGNPRRHAADSDHGERSRYRVHVRTDPIYIRRRRAIAAGIGALLVLGLVVVAFWMLGNRGAGDQVADGDTPVAVAQAPGKGDAGKKSADSASGSEADGAKEDDAAVSTPEPDPVWQQAQTPVTHASEKTALTKVDYLTGGMTPKSVVASNHGLMIANNMMYSHTSTVFDSSTREQVAVLDDAVDLSEFGVEGHPGISEGSPVEAVWTEDGRYAYVSQYTMFGENFGVQGFDACTQASGVGPSFLYRFDAEEMAWDQVIKVGAVPKYVEITPDQSTVLVSNWCDASISVVDVEKAKEIKVIDVNEAPRGIAIMPDSNTAYVVAMYAQSLFKIDIKAGTSELVMNTTLRPRHLNLTEDGTTLYMTVSSANTIYKIDTATDEIVDEVYPGLEPRSVTLSPDESALYVVNYNEATVSKIRTSDMTVIDTVGVDAVPIGIDYDPVTNTVWVACYNGAIYVFDDQSTLLPATG